ncbi:hypothetical protein PN498_26315 [Oscillatoria sp. CS-180]|nr:hypothetical protein [Oscillatoria sp. CS-180]MDB9529533.1 hypothetical protein [Oscillatoria sp. CS-180]
MAKRKPYRLIEVDYCDRHPRQTRGCHHAANWQFNDDSRQKVLSA